VEETAAVGAALQARAAAGGSDLAAWNPGGARRWDPDPHPVLKETARRIGGLRAAALEQGF